MTNLDSVVKSRDITLPTKVHTVKAMVFPVVMYGSESWTIKNAERLFELWCWKRLVRVSWTARRSNQSILKEINWIFIGRTDVEAPILWPLFWCKKPTHWKRPDAGKDWRQEERRMTEDEMVGWHHRLNGHEFEQTLGDSEREAWSTIVHGVAESDTTT